VDCVWARRISNEWARIVEWRKDVAPSTSLRKWFGYERVSACRFSVMGTHTKGGAP
jgi:uncharacterized protein YeaO (DUF488 family)